MDQMQQNVTLHFNSCEDRLIKMADEQTRASELNSSLKFDVDKLQAIAATHEQKIHRNNAEITKLMQDSASLFEGKTDLEKYTKDFNYLKKYCKETL